MLGSQEALENQQTPLKSPRGKQYSIHVHPVIALDIFQTGVTSTRWRKWFTKLVNHCNWSKTRPSILLLTNTLFHSMSRTHTLYQFVLRLFIYLYLWRAGVGGWQLVKWNNGRYVWLIVDPPTPRYIMFILTIKSGNYQLTRTLTCLSYSLPCGTLTNDLSWMHVCVCSIDKSNYVPVIRYYSNPFSHLIYCSQLSDNLLNFWA